MELGYSGVDISKEVLIYRDKETKKAFLEVNIHQEWELYADSSSGAIDTNSPILKHNSAGTFELNVSAEFRSYFLFKTADSTVVLAEKQLPMNGGYNFRDLGGIKTNSGQYLRWGRLFRSDDFHKLTDSDLSYLSSIPLRTIVDFRSEEEIAQAPSKIPSSVKAVNQLQIAPGNVLAFRELVQKSEQEMVAEMKTLYENLILDEDCINSYKNFFSILQSEENLPVIYHCSAGKDRTGMATALVLSSLNVEEDVIMEDYLSSNYYLGDKYSHYKKEYPQISPLLEVMREYLDAGLNKIRDNYGDIITFLKDVLQVNLEKMREQFLYY